MINNVIRPDGLCAERYTMAIQYEINRFGDPSELRLRPVFCPVCRLHYTTVKPVAMPWPSSVAHVVCARCGSTCGEVPWMTPTRTTTPERK